jgi:hypothetical protein
VNRAKLNFSDMDAAVFQMSENNVGALRVLVELSKLPNMDGFGLLLDLDDMNMRGAQIWVGYKYHCGENLEKFKTASFKRGTHRFADYEAECMQRGKPFNHPNDPE